MSFALKEDVDQAKEPQGYRARIERVGGHSAPVYVSVPGFDGRKRQLYGPCPWMPRVQPGPEISAEESPQVGNPALVMFDDTGECWVVAWWPHGGLS